MSIGIISVSAVAGPIRATNHPRNQKIGQQVTMGDDLYFHITPEVARQWIGVLEPIAKDAGDASAA